MKRKPSVDNIIRFAIMLFGAAIGGGLAALGFRMLQTFYENLVIETYIVIVICALVTLLFAALGWFVSKHMIDRVARWSAIVEQSLRETPLWQMISGALGAVFGLAIAALVSQLFRAGLPDLLWAGLSAVLYLMLGYMCGMVGYRRWRELPAMLGGRRARTDQVPPTPAVGCGKILDTSVIIDGRIFDVCKTGFFEGPLIIPQFVLAELQHIADSGDPMRRNRGRRGLDVLAKIQRELDISVEITEADYEDIPEVDAKLLRLARDMSGVVVTNDFNLNKVADVTGVRVLNINDLAGALRPVLLPGEEMRVQVLREGKEHGQGVGYLDDGTMIVIDNGKRYIGSTVEVIVTTVLQTSAGRMIFTKIKQVA